MCVGHACLAHLYAADRVVRQGLADNDVRKEVWPFLLAVYPWTSTGEERARIAEAKR